MESGSESGTYVSKCLCLVGTLFKYRDNTSTGVFNVGFKQLAGIIGVALARQLQQFVVFLFSLCDLLGLDELHADIAV